jgi:hypothetical protein
MGRIASSAPAGGSMAMTGALDPSAHFLADLIQGCDLSCCHISWSSRAVMIRSTGVEGSSENKRNGWFI